VLSASTKVRLLSVPAVLLSALAMALLSFATVETPEAKAELTPVCSICFPASLYSFSDVCEKDHRTDPLGILFHGRSASVGRTEDHLRKHLNWHEGGWTDQRLLVAHSDGYYHCDPNGTAVANRNEGSRHTRSHIRVWYIPASPYNGWERKSVGTPHLDHWIPYEPNEQCGNAFTNGSHAVPREMDIPAKFGGPLTGSGFDYVKYQIAFRMGKGPGHHNLDYEKWGNTEPQGQCNGVQSASNGQGVLIAINHPTSAAGRVARVSTSSWTLNGTVTPDEESVEYWFGYGTKPAEEAEYANKTSISTAAPATGDVNVSKAISGLKPATTYYTTLYARYADGEVEASNEIQNRTCAETGDDGDDRAPGARAIVLCSGAIDTFFRTSTGTLGHTTYSPTAGWQSSDLPGALPFEIAPHAVWQADGSIDVFYRTTSGTLGHSAYDPGVGWSSGTLPGAIASDAHPVVQTNGKIDVFYTMPSGDLGRTWYEPGNGWSSDNLGGSNLASEPHPVLKGSGGIEVFYRTTEGPLGHHWYSPAAGWDHGLLSGSLPTGANPYPIVRPNGAVEVFYRTYAGTLGNTWWESGKGWQQANLGGSLVADPRPVLRGAAVEVFYRTSDGGLGHQWVDPDDGWSDSELAGSVASEVVPLLRPDNTVDLFYRTPSGTLGHTWNEPGYSWSDETLEGSLTSTPHAVAKMNGAIEVFYRNTEGRLAHHYFNPSTEAWTSGVLAGTPSRRWPTSTTNSVSGVNDSQATFNGTVVPDGSQVSYSFQYGTTTSYGSQTSSGTLTAGTYAPISVSRSVGGLAPGTTYHYRLVTDSPEGTTYGADRTFATTSPHIAAQANSGELWTLALPGNPEGGTGWMVATGTSPSVAQLSDGTYRVAFQSTGNELWIYSSDGPQRIVTHLGMLPGTSPSIAPTSGGSYAVAFQGANKELWTYTPAAGGKSAALGMAAGTSPSIAPLAGGAYQVAFQNASNALMLYSSSSGWKSTGLGMLPGTSPAVTALSGGSYMVAAQANTKMLWVYSPTTGGKNTNLGMLPGTNPAIAGLPNNAYQVAFQANDGMLWTYSSTSGWKALGLGMLAGTSPSIGPLADGSYLIAFQANTKYLGAYSPAGGSKITGLGMATGTSPGVD
jgi:hypothetical protein